MSEASALASTEHVRSGWDRRRERMSRDILRAALRLFADLGPDNVTVEQISEAAGISNRTFFRYYMNREAVLAAVPARALASVCERFRDRPVSESIAEAFIAAES